MATDQQPDGAVEGDDAYQPETGESKVWLEMISEAEKVFRSYQDKADAIDKLYADLNRLASVTRDRQFQIFWANVEVLKPSIYARPPIPVVVPKFKDRRPLYRVSSEFLERATSVAFDLTDINSVMLLLRDDVAIVGRGSPWVRYETKSESDTPTEKVCVEYVDRKDFLHEPARNWSEVGWVARRCWMTLEEMSARFKKTSGNAYLQASTQVLRKDNQRGGATRQAKAAVWEIWSKTENKCVWVCEGVDVTLDEDKPHLNLQGFFPCPKPAYATIQRGGLIPVPDVLMYKDQLEEINQLTNRIHALSEALKIKGFYPGGGEIGDAIEAAININDDRKIMVPISNWAAFGSGGDKVIWLPIDVVATTVSGLVELRQSVIGDVYQLSGISDVQRGETDPNETLGAQQLKQMNGSVRIRDKQNELARVARDLVCIAAEIMAENFDKQTLLDMSQMEIPTDADIAKQVRSLEAKAKQINAAMERSQRDPQIQQQAQQNPDQANQLIQQAQQQVQQIMQQIEQLNDTPTIEAVMKFLHDQKIRPFVLDIETDSTIQADEQAEKQARTEFVTALGATVQQFLPVLQVMPQMAPVFGDVLKFALAPFRVGRELEGKIDEAVDAMNKQAANPPPNPEAEKAKADQAAAQQQLQLQAQKQQSEHQARQQELQMKAQIEEARLHGEMQSRQLEAQHMAEQHNANLQQTAAKMQQDQQKGDLEIRKLQLEIEGKQQDLAIKAASAQIDSAAKAQDAEQSRQSFKQQSALTAQKASQEASE